MAIKKFMVVRGQHRWSINVECTYSIFGTFSSESEGTELELEMIDFAVDKFKVVDGFYSGNDYLTFYKDLSFIGQPSVGTREFVVERNLSGIWYGFIDQESIEALFATV